MEKGRTVTSRSHLVFLFTLAALCLSYLSITLAYNHYAMLSVDEFWFAHRIYEYKSGLPYRDFAPYKTILGYYLLLPAMLSDRGIMQTLFWTKDFLALLNMFVLFASSLWLTRFFSRTGILCSLAILISSEIVISYSTQLRVDLPGYWLGFFALLLLLDKRYWLAGVFLGLGFLTTQKTLWYLIACNAALAVQWLMYQRRLQDIKPVMIFNAACAVMIIAYLFFWSLVTDWNTVISSVFHEASAMYRLDWYNSTRAAFWQTIILDNPLLFLSWPCCLFSLLITYEKDKSYAPRLFVTTFAFVILSCLIPYKQVFPYYMQVTIPVFFILYAAFITWLNGFFKTAAPQLLVRPLALWLILACYVLTLAACILIFNLPYIYLLIALIPVLLMAYATRQYMPVLLLRLIVLTGIFMGLLYPLALMPVKLAWLNGSYQRAHIAAINTLLNEGGDYVAGIELIYNKTQPIKGLRHLMAPAVAYLYQPTAKLQEVMLASLYEDPHASMASVIADLQQSSVKFYVNNYRINALPAKIHAYLENEYAHWWGSIYLYAPLIAEGQKTLALKFAGNYFIESRETFVRINGKPYASHTIIYLPRGVLTSNATGIFRLKLIPAGQQVLSNLAFQHDHWEKVIF
jgi:hypothetical protein